jgi:hypothetical protein
MEMPPDGPYADYDHYREEMVTEWIMGSEAIPAEEIARWAVELAQREPKRARTKRQPTPPPAPEAEALAVSFPEAARLLGYSVDHFERHVVPDLRIVTKGRRKTVPRAELIDWLQRNSARALRGS